MIIDGLEPGGAHFPGKVPPEEWENITVESINALLVDAIEKQHVKVDIEGRTKTLDKGDYAGLRSRSTITAAGSLETYQVPKDGADTPAGDLCAGANHR